MSRMLLILSSILLILLGVLASDYRLAVMYGESMSPTIENPTIGVYDKSYEVEDVSEGDLVVYEKHGEKIAHRVVEKTDVYIKISGDNPKSKTHYLGYEYDVYTFHGKIVDYKELDINKFTL